MLLNSYIEVMPKMYTMA